MNNLKNIIQEKLRLGKDTMVEMDEMDDIIIEFMLNNDCEYISNPLHEKDLNELYKEFKMSQKFSKYFFNKDKHFLTIQNRETYANEIMSHVIDKKFYLKIKAWQTNKMIDAINLRLYYQNDKGHNLLHIFIDFEDNIIVWQSGNHITEHEKEQIPTYIEQMINVIQYIMK